MRRCVRRSSSQRVTERIDEAYRRPRFAVVLDVAIAISVSRSMNRRLGRNASATVAGSRDGSVTGGITVAGRTCHGAFGIPLTQHVSQTSRGAHAGPESGQIQVRTTPFATQMNRPAHQTATGRAIDEGRLGLVRRLTHGVSQTHTTARTRARTSAGEIIRNRAGPTRRALRFPDKT